MFDYYIYIPREMWAQMQTDYTVMQLFMEHGGKNETETEYVSGVWLTFQGELYVA